MGLPDGVCNLVSHLEVVDIAKVGAQNGQRHSSLSGQFIDEVSIDLVEALINVDRPARDFEAKDFGKFNTQGRFEPGVLGSFAWDPCVESRVIP